MYKFNDRHSVCLPTTWCYLKNKRRHWYEGQTKGAICSWKRGDCNPLLLLLVLFLFLSSSICFLHCPTQCLVETMESVMTHNKSCYISVTWYGFTLRPAILPMDGHILCSDQLTSQDQGWGLQIIFLCLRLHPLMPGQKNFSAKLSAPTHWCLKQFGL